MNTLLLTGLPRSGTTLACALLNRVPDVLALAEPIQLDENVPRDEAVRAIASFALGARDLALSKGLALSKTDSDWTSDNFMEPPKPDGGMRTLNGAMRVQEIDRPLSADFLLCVKHPGLFTALSQELTCEFRLFAMVRSPLAVLASWQNIDFWVLHGRAPIAERLDPELSARLERLDDRLERQVELMGWFLSKFATLPERQVIRYEDLVVGPEAQLGPIVGPGRSLSDVLSHPIREQDPEERYPGVDLASLARRLQRISSLIERFYPRYGETLADVIDGRRTVLRQRGAGSPDKVRIDFVVAGVQKAGTTALDSYLGRHPAIRMANRKEVHFFDDDFRDWSAPDYEQYHVWFRPPSSTAKAVGDATPIYTYWPNSLERLHAYNSKVRIVVLLRHPSLRAYSHWRMETVAHGVETLDFSAAIREPGRARVAESPQGVHRAFSYVERGFYGAQIERVFELFPREQCWFARTDELWREPGKVL